MGGHVSERYSPVPVGANATVTSSSGNAVGGFLCVTAGNITLANRLALQGVSQAQTIFTNLPVVAGVYYPFPFITTGGYTFTTSSGASGVLGVI